MNTVNRRAFLSMASGGLAASLVRRPRAIGADRRTADRPNILIYIADDQYLASVGCYGSRPSHTPNIDKFAAQGLLFRHAYTNSAICTPNRAVLLSGLYPIDADYPIETYL